LEITSKLDEIVYLNVGGKFFTTSRSTLTKYSPSTMEAMFSGRWKMNTDRDNRVFIDRNGRLFEKILEVLRDPRAVSEVPSKELSAFRREMDFYGLTPFFDLHHDPHDPHHPKYRDLVYVSDFDKNGVFYFLGTKNGQQIWQNPCALGNVLLTSSHLNYVTNGVSGLVSYEQCTVQASPGGSGGNEWFCVQLVQHMLRPTCYTLRTRDNSDTHHPRNWELLVSNDGQKWKTLKKHVNDGSLNGINGTASWDLPAGTEYFRYFRLEQIGNNSSGARYFTIGGMELYGTLIQL